MSERLGAKHYGQDRAKTEQAKAERIIGAELKRGKWTAAELKSRAKGEPRQGSLGCPAAGGDDDDGGPDRGA